MKFISSFVILIVILISTFTTQAQVPALINYQGRLLDGTNLVNGNVGLSLRLFNAAAGGSLLYEDSNTVAVVDGLYSTFLGDQTTVGSLGGALASTNLHLEVAVNGSTLSPRERVASVAYTLRADQAETVADGAITSNKLAAGAVTSDKIADGAVANADLATNAVTSAKILDGTILGADLASNTVTSAQLADSIDLGTTAVSGLLNVYRTAANTPSINLDGSSGSIRGYGSDGALRAALLSGSQFGGLYLYTTNGNLRAYMVGNTSGSSLTLYQADGGTGVFVDGDASGSGLIELRNTNASTRVRLYGQSSAGGGEVSVNDSSGTETIELLGQSGSTTGAKLTLKQDSGTTSIVLDGEYGASGEGGAILLKNSTGGNGLILEGDVSDGGYATFYSSAGNTSILLDGDAGDAGYVSVCTTNGTARVALDGYSVGAGGEISVFDTTGTETIEILGAEDSSTGGQIMMRNASGTSTIQLDSDASGVGCGYIRLYKSNGVATVTIEADNAGDGRITTQELQITGGSDLSEQFNIQAGAEALQPGMVVSIDAARPGELTVSTRAYDRTVAGVISGAGGVKPGLLMGQQGTQADGKHPVALTGRVYCLADASAGAIQPGDLLTTSGTPGHAMKVADYARAQGAIIGKAMTPLKEGQGLLLVLVSLQ